MEKIKKVVLAYSGGLDTSVILTWLVEKYGCEVIAFVADVGQGEELGPVRAKAKKTGASKVYVENLQDEFVRDFVFPALMANAVYEGAYLLGTSIARPLIAKKQIEVARKEKADAVSHGATGKGNDQVRFELTYYALMPGSPRHRPVARVGLQVADGPDRTTRRSTASPRRSRRPSRTPATGTCCTSASRGGSSRIRGPSRRRTCSSSAGRREKAPNRPEYVEVDFAKGIPVAVDGKKMGPAKLLARLNALGGKHGIGRVDLVENRYVGMKSRGVYETPGGHDPARGAPRRRVAHARPRGDAPARFPDAAVRGADLQRLLVFAGDGSAQGDGRRDPGERDGHRAAEAVQGQRSPWPAGRAPFPSTGPTSRRSRRRRSTTRPTRPGSSRSTALRLKIRSLLKEGRKG